MINIKTPEEIELMAASGKILGDVMQKVLAKAAPGMTTAELDKYTDDLIMAAGGQASFKLEKGYHHATCMCVNDIVVHGVPGDYKLQRGDVLGVDAGVLYQGWHSDASWSIIVGNPPKSEVSRQNRVFLDTGERALELAIAQCHPGRHIGDISRVIEETVRHGGYSPVKQLVGHGIGQSLHEDPEIPCYVRGEAKNTPEIRPGMVLAVEVIYNLGKSPVVYGSDDGWTIVTRDGSPSGLFEHTVAITEAGPRVLTLAA